jgi:hypothetical protein
MSDKYKLTLEQIHQVIESYQSGKFCKEGCYGCCGDSHYQTGCKECNPKLESYLESIQEVN